MSEKLKYLSKRMESVKEYSLENEVFLSSLEAMKIDSSLTIEQAIEAGCNEWDV